MKGILKSFCVLAALFCALDAAATSYSLSNDKLSITIDQDGRVTSLRNNVTGTDYAGGGALWRLYFDTHEQKEVQVSGANHKPSISTTPSSIVLKYKGLKADSRVAEKQRFNLTLTVSIEDERLRFGAEIENNEPHTIIRELHYPLVGNLALPAGFRLLTTTYGGHFYKDVKKTIVSEGIKNPYMTPAQFFRQFNVVYPLSYVASNCYALVGDGEGLYFGSHDPSLENTGHGLRVYPSAPETFDRLECGIYKYPNCVYGNKWSRAVNVIAPYCGDWTWTAKEYRKWVDSSWWDRHEPPMWVKRMKSWQRVIFKHQYGEYFFRYKDLYGRIADVERSVGADAVLIFGWWKAGMDNSNPDYVPDPDQGGEKGLKDAIRRYRDAGGHPLLYVNGKIIDRESEFYRSGKAEGLTFKDNNGDECVENYKFTAHGTFLGGWNFRNFVVADTGNPKWQQLMLGWADMAYNYGASSIFYDQMGRVETRLLNWDTSGEFPIPEMAPLRVKGEAMKLCRNHAHALNPEFAIGAEHITDYLSMILDYNHGDGVLDFIDWFRYAFPELIVSDRRLRDDTDVERRVNWTILKGVRNDIEIYRCRDLIDRTPRYQAYLAKVNALKDKYADCLLLGTFRYMDFFTCDNRDVQARCFVNGNRMAIVATQELSKPQRLSARLSVPGYRLVDSSTLGTAEVAQNGSCTTLGLGQYDLAVMLYEKE